MAKWGADKKSDEERSKEVQRLQGMMDGSMKADLKKWIVERKNILMSGVTSTEEL